MASVDTAGNATFATVTSQGKGSFTEIDISNGTDSCFNINQHGLFTKQYFVKDFSDETTDIVTFSQVLNIFNYQFVLTESNTQLVFTGTDFSEYAIHWFVNINSEVNSEIFEVYNLNIGTTQITFKRKNLESNTQLYENITLFIEMIKKNE